MYYMYMSVHNTFQNQTQTCTNTQMELQQTRVSLCTCCPKCVLEWTSHASSYPPSSWRNDLSWKCMLTFCLIRTSSQSKSNTAALHIHTCTCRTTSDMQCTRRTTSDVHFTHRTTSDVHFTRRTTCSDICYCTFVVFSATTNGVCVISIHIKAY